MVEQSLNILTSEGKATHRHQSHHHHHNPHPSAHFFPHPGLTQISLETFFFISKNLCFLAPATHQHTSFCILTVQFEVESAKLKVTRWRLLLVSVTFQNQGPVHRTVIKVNNPHPRAPTSQPPPRRQVPSAELSPDDAPEVLRWLQSQGAPVEVPPYDIDSEPHRGQRLSPTRDLCDEEVSG